MQGFPVSIFASWFLCISFSDVGPNILPLKSALGSSFSGWRQQPKPPYNYLDLNKLQL